MPAIRSVLHDGFLSFPSGAPAFEPRPLDVIIGPNDTGKSNVVEAFDLLAATPLDSAAAVRAGSGTEEWPWKGPDNSGRARIKAVLDADREVATVPLGVRRDPVRVEVLDEVVVDAVPARGDDEVSCHYRFGRDGPVIAMRDESAKRRGRGLPPLRSSLVSVRRDRTGSGKKGGCHADRLVRSAEWGLCPPTDASRPVHPLRFRETSLALPVLMLLQLQMNDANRSRVHL